MLFQSLPCCATTGLVIVLFLFISARYTYSVNEKKNTADPTKKAFAPLSCWRAPLLVPVFLLINIPAFIVVSLVFGIFLVIFPFTLLLFRKPFFIKWIQQLALKVGTALLEIDTELLAMAGLYQPPARQTSAS